MNKFAFIFFVFMLLSCTEDDFGKPSPSVRNLESIENLKNKLSEAPYGWRLMYFPTMDSLLFSDKNQILEQSPGFRNNIGVGGHYYTIKFSKDGTMQMLWDNDDATATEMKSSEYAIEQNAFTQLSFITPTYIHALVNEVFQGKADFLYTGHNLDKNLVFTTLSSLEPAREYIELEPLKNETDFNEFVKVSKENRLFFDRMDNPQIIIKHGSRIYFKSDMKVKLYTLDSEIALAERMEHQRYHYFRFNKKPDYILGGALQSTALGSGYVGTEHGLTFRPGIRLDSKYVFHDFIRQDNKFVCELVKVYDPFIKNYRYISKHLAPSDAETTGYVAEIEDVIN